MFLLGALFVVAIRDSARVNTVLRHADVLLHQMAPYPTEFARDTLDEALDMYRRIDQVLGPSNGAKLGVARSLFAMGRYGAAAKEFAAAGHANDAADSGRREAILASLDKTLGDRRVLQVERVDHKWVALIVERKSDWHNASHSVSLRLFQVVAGCPEWIGAESIVPDRGGDDQWPHLYVVRLHLRSAKPTVMICRAFPAADCSPADVRFYTVTGSALVKGSAFKSLAECGVHPPTAKHGLLVQVAPTFKVWWPDVYESRGGRFMLANRNHPELFGGYAASTGSFNGRSYYPWRMIFASVLDIQGRFTDAIREWRAAELDCALAARNRARYERANGYVGFYGDPPTSLREIRRRLRWLRRRDHDHALLYRPYDFDLQVWPYRLGPALVDS